MVNTGQSTKQRAIVSQRVNRLASSGIRKFFDLLASMEGVISLGVGEPDFTTPLHIRKAAIRSIEEGHTHYTSNLGMPELRQELAKHLNKRYSIEYNPNGELLVSVGVSEAMDLTMRSIIDPGDEVIMTDPCFVAYEPAVIMAGGEPVKVPTSEAGNFEVSAADIEARITDKTKAILLGFPANPTGAVMSRDKLMQIAEVAQRHQLLVVSDEIYSQLVYGVEHTCVASLPGMKERTILLDGFSKSYAMTGWRVGFAAAPKEIIAAMTKVHQYTIMSAPTAGQMAAIEALKNGESSAAEMIADYNRRRQVIVKGFNEIGLSCFEPKGAFYAFPSIKVTGMTSEEFSEKLLTEERVAAVAGSAFGECGEGYIRCCYATSLAEIEEALNRMKRFVDKYRKD